MCLYILYHGCDLLPLGDVMRTTELGIADRDPVADVEQALHLAIQVSVRNYTHVTFIKETDQAIPNKVRTRNLQDRPCTAMCKDAQPKPA